MTIKNSKTHNDILELKQIWKENSIYQNISWICNIILFLLIFPYYFLRMYWTDQ